MPVAMPPVPAKRTLKAKAPEDIQESKPKTIIFGKPGVGKTWVSLEFPDVYYMDVEGGAKRSQYRKKLKESKAGYFGKEEGSQDFKAVLEEIKLLATTEHNYKTLVIDSFSKLYNIARAVAEEEGGSEYSRDKKEAAKPSRQLIYWLDRLDMNVILVCHSVAKWVREGDRISSDGETYDGFDKMEYELDLCLEVVMKGSIRQAIVRKSRMEGFPYLSTFPWNYTEFSKRAGEATMLRKAEVFKVATEEQIKEILRLLETVKVEPDWKAQVFKKYGVQQWEDMESSKVAACIEILNKKLKGDSENGANPKA